MHAPRWWSHRLRSRRCRIGLLLACLALVTAACSASHTKQYGNQPGLVPIAKRAAAGKVTGALLTGGRYSLSADLGHVVLINYFASWCGPCQTETPQMQLLSDQVAPSGVKFIGVDTKDASQDASKSWLAGKDVTFPVIWDQASKTLAELGHFYPLGLPATVIIDKHGRLAWTHDGILEPADISPLLTQLNAES